MNRIGYRYRFSRDVDLREAKATLLLALLATEGLFGHSRLVMDADFVVDESINAIIIDARTLVGMTVSLIFTAFVAAEFGAGAFDVRQVDMRSAPLEIHS